MPNKKRKSVGIKMFKKIVDYIKMIRIQIFLLYKKYEFKEKLNVIASIVVNNMIKGFPKVIKWLVVTIINIFLEDVRRTFKVKKPLRV